jgi:PEP-CTERM motif
MKLKSAWSAGLLACASLVAAAPASAVVITSTADDFTVLWSQDVGSGVTVQGSAFFDVTAISGSSISLSISLNNLLDLGTSSGWMGGWSSIGWSSTPDISGGNWITYGSHFDNGAIGTSIPSLNAVEICFYSGGGCAGGGQQLLLADGSTDSFAVQLFSASSNLSSWTFDNFGAKFQTGLGSFEFYGCTQQCTPTNVPEPGSLALMGLALAGIGGAYTIRRRRRAK